jgi:hypothetical protein
VELTSRLYPQRLGLVKFSDVVLAGYAGLTVLAESYVVNLTCMILTWPPSKSS